MTRFPDDIPAQTRNLIRFGYGLSPRAQPPASTEDLIAGLATPDVMRDTYPNPSYSEATTKGQEQRKASVRGRKGDAAEKERGQALRTWVNNTRYQAPAVAIARILDTETPFRERLHWYWANHFALRDTSTIYRAATAPFIDEAIRPHLGGRFADMLKAVATHPAMLLYLDQAQSYGPASQHGLRDGKGLNENYARELLELHTLGSGYTQEDVREAAQLLTGMTVTSQKSFEFKPEMVEPGDETVIGKTYVEGRISKQSFAVIEEFLEDLATHPNTARHVSHRLARHFVADAPAEALIDAMAAAFVASSGNLSDVYRVMIEHPETARQFGTKIKPAFTFMASTCLAVGMRAGDLLAIDPTEVNEVYGNTLARMGDFFLRTPSPEGLPDVAPAWITPQMLAARVEWAMNIPFEATLEPRDLGPSILPGVVRDEVVLAASRAETRREGVGLVLASPEFNRM